MNRGLHCQKEGLQSCEVTRGELKSMNREGMDCTAVGSTAKRKDCGAVK